MSRKPIEDGFKDIEREGKTAKYMAELRHRLRRLEKGACMWSGCAEVPQGLRFCPVHNARVNERNRARRLLKKQKTQI